MSYDFVTILGLHYIDNANFPAPVTASVDDGVIKGDFDYNKPLTHKYGDGIVLGVIDKMPHYIMVFDETRKGLRIWDRRVNHFTNRWPEALILPTPALEATNWRELNGWFEKVKRLFGVTPFTQTYFPPAPFKWTIDTGNDPNKRSTVRQLFGGKCHIQEDGTVLIPKPDMELADKIIDAGLALWKDDIKAAHSITLKTPEGDMKIDGNL